jgi:hypothetical protein
MSLIRENNCLQPETKNVLETKNHLLTVNYSEEFIHEENHNETIMENMYALIE